MRVSKISKLMTSMVGNDFNGVMNHLGTVMNMQATPHNYPNVKQVNAITI